MMASLNRVQLIGNLGRDPEVRHTQDGKPVVHLSLATSDTWKDKTTGEKKERTEWHRIVVFNEALAGIIERYLRKGSKIYIEGALQTRKWTDQAGAEKYTTEIVLQQYRGELVMLGDRQEDAAPASAAGTGYQAPENPGGGTPAGGDIDDEIPF